MQSIDSIDEFLRITKGAPAQNLSLAVASFSETDYFIPTPARSFLFSINMIVSGSVTFRLNSKKYTVEAGQLFVVAPGNILSFEAGVGTFEGLALFFDRHFLSEVITDSAFLLKLPIFQLGANPILTLSDVEQHRIMSMINAVRLYDAGDASTPVNAVKYILLAMLTDINHVFSRLPVQRASEAAPGASRITDLFLGLVSQQYLTNRRIADYASQLVVSSKHLSESVKRVTGKPAMFWIDLMVVQEAQILLRQSKLSIGQISDSLGFSDPSAFGKFFRLHMQVSPGSYRKSLTIKQH